MKVVRVNDNSVFDKKKLEELPELVSRIANKTVQQLCDESLFLFPDIIHETESSNKQFLLREVDDNYETSNLMGFIGCDDEKLVIESRFTSGTDDYFLQYLFSKVLDLPNAIALDVHTNRENRVIDYLMLMFPRYLRIALRKGVYRTYVREQYNDTNVKGTINIKRHISENTPFVGNVAYDKREYSYDNYITELIRHTIELISKRSIGSRLLRTVNCETKEIIEATPMYQLNDRLKVISDNKKRPIVHAYFHEYRRLQILCLLILCHEKHQISSSNMRLYGILFDGAWLWEEYVNTLILEQYYHPNNRLKKGRQYLFGNSGLIYPDFISKSPENRIIADAKYKPCGNISGDDYLQLLAYMFRFDGKKGYYIYPESGNKPDAFLRLSQGSTYENNVSSRSDISVEKIGFNVPSNVTSYQDFIDKIAHSETEFKQKLIRN